MMMMILFMIYCENDPVPKNFLENTFLSFQSFDKNANVGNNTEDKIGDSTIVDLQYFLALTP